MKEEIGSLRGLDTAWLSVAAGASNRPIIFFIHGCPDDATTWRRQIEYFSAKHYSVLAPFARGVGASVATNDRRRYGFEAIALDHFEILRTLDPSGKRKVIVIGHDIGAIHAWKLSRLLGSRLAALILINGPDLAQLARRMTNLRQVVKSWYIAFFQLPFLPEVLLKHWESVLVKRAQAKFGMPSDTTLAIAPFLNQYREAFRALPEALKSREPVLAAPVLVLWGKDDGFLEVPSMNELTPLASDVTIRIVDGDHWLHHHQADRVNVLIDRFLEEKL